MAGLWDRLKLGLCFKCIFAPRVVASNRLQHTTIVRDARLPVIGTADSEHGVSSGHTCSAIGLALPFVAASLGDRPCRGPLCATQQAARPPMRALCCRGLRSALSQLTGRTRVPTAAPNSAAVAAGAAAAPPPAAASQPSRAAAAMSTQAAEPEVGMVIMGSCCAAAEWPACPQASRPAHCSGCRRWQHPQVASCLLLCADPERHRCRVRLAPPTPSADAQLMC